MSNIPVPVNRTIDHALLKPDMTPSDARAQIELGLRYHVRTVCVRPCDIPLALDLCRGSDTGVSCVLAFPHGGILSASKGDEARRYVDLGAHEIDMVANIGWIRAGLWEQVADDIRAVTSVARPAGVLVKVILETCLLAPEQAAKATEAAIRAQADFVKTSTGFAASGASEEMVGTLVEAAGGRIGVKASGGIRTREQALRYLELGATRLGVGGTSTPVLCT
ncbi:MAG: deoxyribose-phosphate aldolase [Kiritimatiellia bacterium]|jgi:deoxyribose-phosphate aldolase